MTKVIIDAQSGTVVPLDWCYLVDLSELDGDDKHFLDVASDSEISEMAIRKGKNILKIMEDTLYGEITRFTSVSYSPGALRDEAEVLLEVKYDNDDLDDATIKKMLQWVCNEATDEQLRELGTYIVMDDNAWNGYQNNFTSNLFYYMTEVVSKPYKG